MAATLWVELAYKNSSWREILLKIASSRYRERSPIAGVHNSSQCSCRAVWLRAPVLDTANTANTAAANLTQQATRVKRSRKQQ